VIFRCCTEVRRGRTIQGLLELADMAYVGAGVLGSAAAWIRHHEVSVYSAGIPIVKHVTLLRSAWEKNSKRVQNFVESKLKYPVLSNPRIWDRR